MENAQKNKMLIYLVVLCLIVLLAVGGFLLTRGQEEEYEYEYEREVGFDFEQQLLAELELLIIEELELPEHPTAEQIESINIVSGGEEVLNERGEINIEIFKQMLLGITVSIEREASEEEIERIGEELRSIEGISEVNLTTPEEAFEIMRERLGERAELMDGIDSSMFPSMYFVRMVRLSVFEDVYSELNEIDNVVISGTDMKKKLFSRVNR